MLSTALSLVGLGLPTVLAIGGALFIFIGLANWTKDNGFTIRKPAFRPIVFIGSLLLLSAVILFVITMNWINSSQCVSESTPLPTPTPLPTSTPLLTTTPQFTPTSLVVTFTPTIKITDTPTIAASATLEPAVQRVNEYFLLINHAKTPSDLDEPRNYLSPPLQCLGASICDETAYKNYWWNLKVLYKLYYCDPYKVVVEETLFSRTDYFYARPLTGVSFYQFDLMFSGNELIIYSSAEINGISSSCYQVVDKSTPEP